MRKSLYDMEPDEDADIEAWKEWAYRLRTRAITGDERKEQAQILVTKLKREVKEKNEVFIFYKDRVTDLENTIKNLKRNPAYRFIKCVISIKGRVIGAWRGNNA
jgi:chromosome segregation ATPase